MLAVESFFSQTSAAIYFPLASKLLTSLYCFFRSNSNTNTHTYYHYNSPLFFWQRHGYDS